MTLQVNVLVPDETTGRYVYLAMEFHKTFFGFYQDLFRLWGSELMIELGLVLLPNLKNGLYCGTKEELDLLEKEMLIAWENVDVIDEKLEIIPEYFLMHIRNVLDAIAIAREVNGTVTIG